MQELPPVLIVSHGQPSDPDGAARELARLAGAVAALLPGREVGAATLAETGALEAALARLGPGGALFPLFMAGGWFTRTALPRRLAEAGAIGWTVLEPMGCDPAVHDLAVRIIAEAGQVSAVVLAAHGSGQSRVPADIARHVAGLIAARCGVPATAAFIDQSPRLADIVVHGPRAVCLPYFAALGGHVATDIPAALAQAGFAGRILPALGLDPRLPAIIAAAVGAGKPVCAGPCAWARG
ncbi:MAG: sirohydrochlorin chelatase [Paracoccaceae bacterium]